MPLEFQTALPPHFFGIPVQEIPPLPRNSKMPPFVWYGYFLESPNNNNIIIIILVLVKKKLILMYHHHFYRHSGGLQKIIRKLYGTWFSWGHNTAKSSIMPQNAFPQVKRFGAKIFCTITSKHNFQRFHIWHGIFEANQSWLCIYMYFNSFFFYNRYKPVYWLETGSCCVALDL